MQLKEIARGNNSSVIETTFAATQKSGVIKQGPFERELRMNTFRYERILKAVFHNEQRMKLLSDLMFLVVSASLNDKLIARAANLKARIAQGEVNARKKR